MTDFYIKTETAIAGPFTGVEVREATLARIVLPDTGIGGSRQGPWTRAAEAGLFSDKHVPLPHPPDTQVPRFRLTGVSEAFEGPFKLRELIGFAARRMLPRDALVQADGQSGWTPVTRIRILQACLSGELVPAGTHADQEIERLSHRVDGAHDAEARWKGAKTARPRSRLATVPSQSPSQQSAGESDEAATSVSVEPPDLEESSALAEAPEEENSPSLAEFNQQWRTSLRSSSGLRLPRLSRKFILALAVGMLIPLVWVLLGDGGMHRDELLGDWVYLDSTGNSQNAEKQSGKPDFGISFREDGTCVVFNTRGPSWSGEFDWVPRKDDQAGFKTLASMQSQIEKVDPSHQRAAVKPGDGYIRLTGSFSKEPPLIGKKRIRQCYVRRVGETLHLGYIAVIQWDQSRKTTEAGWLELSPSIRRERESEPEVGESIDGSYLLAELGLPDEARPLHPFERPTVSDPALLLGLQVVRYGRREYILSSDGQLQDLTKASWDQGNLPESVGTPGASQSKSVEES